jgi:hypothetical protein
MHAMRSWGLRADRNASLSSALSEARKEALPAPDRDITDIPAKEQLLSSVLSAARKADFSALGMPAKKKKSSTTVYTCIYDNVYMYIYIGGECCFFCDGYAC